MMRLYCSLPVSTDERPGAMVVREQERAKLRRLPEPLTQEAGDFIAFF